MKQIMVFTLFPSLFQPFRMFGTKTALPILLKS
nr:MAG TPA: hypothetical protein [Bacteriophage sp.]